jgi:hypothetical protein
MNILNPSVIRSLYRFFNHLEHDPIHEHEAVHVHDIDIAITGYQKLGYKLIKRLEKVAFIQSPSEKRLELIPSNVPEHNAWATKSLHDWEYAYFKLRELQLFTQMPEYDITLGDDFRAVMFQDQKYGVVIQLVWRKEQIFEELFT